MEVSGSLSALEIKLFCLTISTASTTAYTFGRGGLSRQTDIAEHPDGLNERDTEVVSALRSHDYATESRSRLSWEFNPIENSLRGLVRGQQSREAYRCTGTIKRRIGMLSFWHFLSHDSSVEEGIVTEMLNEKMEDTDNTIPRAGW